MGTKPNYKTKQREQLLDYMKTVPGKHFTVNDVCEYLHRQGSTIGQTTVYRQIEKMVDEGIMQKYVIDAMKANLLPTPMESSELSYLNTYKDKAMHDIGLAGQHAPMGVKSFNLWSGGHLSINGTTNRMLGLMVFQTGSLSLHQKFRTVSTVSLGYGQ